MGEPHLYEFTTQLSVGKHPVERQSHTVGIRSVEVVREKDEYGTGFLFKLNGVPVFSKGANYIPCDIFLPRVTPEVYENTIRDAVKANMNMLRVWGGGIYEDDYFYELCDKQGIMAWQDFMFACSVYPAEGELLENIRREAIDNVKRLRNHPSLVLWCGNNEILDALFNWGGGWLKVYRDQDPEYAETIWNQYTTLFHEVLPEVVSTYNPEVYYLPTSPFSDIGGTRDSATGDYHYWTTWQQGLPIATFNDARSRYFSEYGFQSFPVWESVAKYAPRPEDHDIYSEVMMWHQRAGINGNKTIEKCLLHEYGTPKDFEALLYMSQLLQGDAIKIAIEAHRRDMPYCMGSLYWQHNDCWPVASWASRDYYGRWKAQHYFARKAFEEILVSCREEDGTFHVYGISDRLKTTRATLSITVQDLAGNILQREALSVTLPPNQSTLLFSTDTHSFQIPKQAVVQVQLREKNGKEYSNLYFSGLQKEMDYPQASVKIVAEPTQEGIILRLSADQFARGIYLSIGEEEGFFEDNFFDLLPGEEKNVFLRTAVAPGEVKKKLSVRSLVDFRK